MNRSNEAQQVPTCSSCSCELDEKFSFVYAQVKDNALVKNLANETLCRDCAEKYKRKIDLFLATEDHLKQNKNEPVFSAEAGREGQKPDPEVTSLSVGGSASGIREDDTFEEISDLEDARTFEEWLQRLYLSRARVRILDHNNFVHEGVLMLVDRRGVVLIGERDEMFIPYEKIASLTRSNPRRPKK